MAAQVEATELPVDKPVNGTADAAGTAEPTATAEEADQAEQPVPSESTDVIWSGL